MNDPLKRFIDHHRNELDDLEPSPDLFLKIKADLKKDNPKEVKIVKLALYQKWLSAAAVVIVLIAGYLIFYAYKNEPTLKGDQTAMDKKNKNNMQKSNDAMPISPEVDQVSSQKNTAKNHVVKAVARPAKLDVDLNTIYKDLQDSTSSSNRLAAILKIGKSGIINYDIADRLAKTLATDDNNNVRLAVLNLLGQYSEDSYVSNIFLKALDTQKDPIIQLGLIELLKRTDNPHLDNRLYALANDPNTFATVKDQAYLVLLNQNKL